MELRIITELVSAILELDLIERFELESVKGGKEEDRVVSDSMFVVMVSLELVDSLVSGVELVW